MGECYVPNAFPAVSKYAAGLVDGVPTEASCIRFSDKILITISQDGILSQWIKVPLTTPAVQLDGQQFLISTQDSLPLTHLNPTTLLGTRGDNREMLAHGIAAKLASRLTLMKPDDRRIMILGLGLRPGEPSREQFFDVIDLAFEVL